MRPEGRGAPFSAAAWGVVAAVGLLLLVIVFALGLFGRLGSGQDLVDNDSSGFQEERVQGARAGINIVSEIVDTADPITTKSGGAAGEVPKLIKFVSSETALTPAQVLVAVQQAAPKTTKLLQSLPLSDVSKELPGLLKFLGTTLKLSPTELNAALAKNFPALSQTISSLPR